MITIIVKFSIFFLANIDHTEYEMNYGIRCKNATYALNTIYQRRATTTTANRDGSVGKMIFSLKYVNGY